MAVGGVESAAYHHAMACVSRGLGLIVTLALAAVLAPVPIASAETAASAGSRTYFRPCDEVLYRPRHVQLACGDGNFYLEHMSWRYWNGAVTPGSGYAEANDCEPTCAGGHFHRYRVAVNLDGRHRCPDGRLYYSHLVIHNVATSRAPFPREFDPLAVNCDGTRT